MQTVSSTPGTRHPYHTAASLLPSVALDRPTHAINGFLSDCVQRVSGQRIRYAWVKVRGEARVDGTEVYLFVLASVALKNKSVKAVLFVLS